MKFYKFAYSQNVFDPPKLKNINLNVLIRRILFFKTGVQKTFLLNWGMLMICGHGS